MNKVVHFELPAEDPDRAQKFYQEAFDWEVNAVPNMPYWMIHTVAVDKNQMPKESGAINGGMMQKDENNNTSVVVVKADHVDAAVKKVEEAGGKLVTPKMEVGNMGYYARIADTEGNVIGIWEDKPKS